MAHIMVQVTHIIEAVKSTVPRELWGEIRRKLDQLEKHPGSQTSRRKPAMKLMTAMTPSRSPRRTTRFTPNHRQIIPPDYLGSDVEEFRPSGWSSHQAGQRVMQ